MQEIHKYSTLMKKVTTKKNGIELIASNFVNEDKLWSSRLCNDNKYAEGCGKRYYGGCQHVDETRTTGH